MSAIIIRQKSFHVVVFAAMFLILAFILSGCVEIVAPTDMSMVKNMQSTQKEIADFYGNMSKDNQRSYAKYEQGYGNIEKKLQNLVIANKAKSANDDMTAICKAAVSMWQLAKNDHLQHDTLTDGMVKYYAQMMDKEMQTMINAEQAKSK